VIVDVPAEIRCRCVLDRRLGASQSQAGRCAKDNSLLPVPVIELRFLSRQARSKVPVPAELFANKMLRDN
jgi:hypothetical protein